MDAKGVMAGYLKVAEQQLRGYLARLQPAERAHFEQTVAELRDEGAGDGVHSWNEDHLVGLLFATNTMRSGVRNAHEARQISHDAMEVVEEVIAFNERFLVALVKGI